MRNNKILATAMTTALAGALSAGGVSAGTMTVTFPKPIPVSVATEAIGTNQTLPNTCGTTVKVRYQLDLEEKLDLNDLITLKLLEGSSLAENVVFDTGGAAAGQVSPGTLTIDSGSSGSGVFALSSGGDGTPTLEFAIQGSGIVKGSTLDFTFCIGNADILKEQGQSIGVNLSINGSDIKSDTILISAQGSKATIKTDDNDGKVKVNIGSDAGAKKLTGSNLGEDTATLGDICLDANDGVLDNDLSTPWTFGKPTYQLTVSDAPFNASIGHTVPDNYDKPTLSTAIDDGSAQIMVFLDVGTINGTFDPAEDIPATTVTTTGATFAITDNDLEYLTALSPESGERCASLVFKVSGNDEIKTHDVAPTGKLTLTFGSVPREFSGKLNHIKRSGTVCVLYNIPGPNSIENANIRVTNKSATPDGTLMGTLRLPDGTEIFTDYDILTASGLGLIGANQTMYLNTDTLNTIAQSASNPKGPWTDGWSRAILRLETNLDTVEMMALIRDDDVMGAPLMNMSTGASGNGCGR